MCTMRDKLAHALLDEKELKNIGEIYGESKLTKILSFFTKDTDLLYTFDLAIEEDGLIIDNDISILGI